MMLADVPGKQKTSPRLRNVIATESWLDVPMFLFREKTFGFTASKSSLH
jgi:hypothetical protein